MRKLCPILAIGVLIPLSLVAGAATSAVGSPMPQVLRDVPAYHGGNPHPHRKLGRVVTTGAGKLKPAATLQGYGTVNIQSDLGPAAQDKVRLDGATAPFTFVLTNISTETTVTFSSITTDNPDSFAASMTCTTLVPGQSCTATLIYTPTSLCDGAETTITITDDDPAEDNNEDPAGTLTYFFQGYGSDSGMQLDDLTDSKLTPTALAQSLVGQGVTVSNVTYTGAARAAGNFSSTASIIGFNSGIVLSTGAVRNVIGPNCDPGITVENGSAGDADLNTLLNAGNDGDPLQTYDAAVLEFDFVPIDSSISFQYTFSSDEYNEFVFDYNDVFGFFLNGNNIAFIPGTTTPVSINTVNNGNSTGTPDNPPVNPQDFVNNDFQYPAAAPYDTEMDGFTIVFTAQATVTPNQTNHIKLAIADAIDYDVDSNVFIKAGSLTSADLSITPISSDFGSVAVGSTSEPLSFTVANIGTQAIDIDSIATTGDFTQTNNCDDGLNPGAGTGTSCIVQVSFVPTAAGARAGTITVTYTASGQSNQQTVNATLTGTATGAVGTITLSPTTLAFNSQVINTTSPVQTVTVTNTGTTSVTIASVAAAAGFAQTNNCTTLAASATCTVSVTFTPTTATAFSGNLTITSTASGSPQSVALSGTGVNSPVIISIAPGGSNTVATVPGGTAYYGLVITAVPGFSGTVQLGCTTSSPQISCTAIPSSITLSASGSTEVAFAIQTYCQGTTTNNGFAPLFPGGGFGGPLALLLITFTLGGAVWTFQRKPRIAVAFALTLVAVIGSAACSSVAKGPNGATPAGTYTLTLSATTNGQTVSLPAFLKLVVN
jgi:hypothetical protein